MLPLEYELLHQDCQNAAYGYIDDINSIIIELQKGKRIRATKLSKKSGQIVDIDHTHKGEGIPLEERGRVERPGAAEAYL